ncbi:MAG TPA: Asp-tRNA(Asn)/Glu-tRNA(Gln) amidotransferase subunit GatB [Candidatus Nanoarchaeia archaeon]|nr:Asp-tRNA(Asn)/Glu-tRNA(Gln) amidotransferase subunit GatB [Candidatus Nanoarchaeia archaeon]
MVKIGLEIHGYINTHEKLFCTCKVGHGLKHALPNTNICPICTGQPGSKPLLPNKEAVKKAIQIALVLGCKVSKKMPWQRKHYSWPDLPKGFQSTMSGPHSIPNGISGNFMGIGITECHLEEDPAAWNPETGEIDYNRSGSPLIEIVTDPDFKSKEEVVDWLRNLLAVLDYIKVIDRNFGVKADVNISIGGGKRVEIKNVNSLRKISDAIDVEVDRQEKDLPKIQQTRSYDEKAGTTKLMRTKDNAQDYRFISDPDLPVLEISEEWIEKLKKSLPETPQDKLKKLIEEYKIEKKYAEMLIKKLSLVELFEKTLEKIKPEIAIPWVTIELLSVANYNKLDVDEMKIDSNHFIELLEAIQENKIIELKAKDILRKWVPNSISPSEEINNSLTISGEEVKNMAKEVILENSKAVEDYKSGKTWAINFLIGQIMKKSNKRADFKFAKKILEDLLK